MIGSYIKKFSVGYPNRTYFSSSAIPPQNLFPFVALIAFFFSWQIVFALDNSGSDTSIKDRYENALNKLASNLTKDGSLKSSVFIVENAFYSNAIDENQFDKQLSQLAMLCNSLYQSKKVVSYKGSDSINYSLSFGIFSILNDTIYILSDSFFLGHRPYSYNFSDPTGKIDWSNMFVYKLLQTHQGNCHSLAYLYKILADELNVKCWLALAPNHIYIRNFSKQIGWYNTELTSGTFPTDAWIATTGYVSTDAIRSGVYMDTLSNQQSIALCILDLAKGYEFQTRNYYDSFILKCCDLVLRYHTVNPQALLLRAETLQKVYFKLKKENNSDSLTVYKEMEEAYITLAKLGYREMPEKMYLQWLSDLPRQKDKYTNKQVKYDFRNKNNSKGKTIHKSRSK